MKRIIYIPFDHLHMKYGALKGSNPNEDLVVLVESARMVSGDKWNKVRLYFLISSARHFVEELKSAGFETRYI